MRRRRISPVTVAGILAVLSAAALMLIIWSSEGGLREPDATARQRTVDVIVQTRLAATAQMRTLAAEVTVGVQWLELSPDDPFWGTATALAVEATATEDAAP